MNYFCYVVECANGAYYTGWTVDPARRLKQHNAGKGARYTRLYGPVRLVYVEAVPNRNVALKREAEIKKLKHTGKSALIAQAKQNLVDQFVMDDAEY
jgi:putative endonuclease